MLGKLYLTLYWIVLVSAIVVFWISLRDESLQVELSLVALLLWGISFLINRYLIKREKEEKIK